jgi:pimeloyl-ACP methyl ester carboxylesterase
MTDQGAQAGRLVRVDDFDMWVEISGAGAPLVYLNGGFASTDFARGAIDALSAHFTVYAFDARGHGRSNFGAGPITYAREAADAVALMNVLGLPNAHFFGHSDGGCVALHLLFDYPHRVRTATLAGTPYSRAAYSAASAQMSKELPATLARGEADAMGMRDALLGMGLTSEKVIALAAGLQRAWATTPNFTLDMLAEIDRPVLVIEAGADPFIALDQFEAITRAVPGARALRLPEMTHGLDPFVPDIVAAVVAFAGDATDAA